MLKKILLRYISWSVFRDHLRDIDRHAMNLDYINFILDSEEVYAVERRAYLMNEGQAWLKVPTLESLTNEARIGAILIKNSDYKYFHPVMFERGVWIIMVYPDYSVRRYYLENVYPIKST